MNMETASYIFYCLEEDSAYKLGVSSWCDKHGIEVSDFKQFELMVIGCIDELGD